MSECSRSDEQNRSLTDFPEAELVPHRFSNCQRWMWIPSLEEEFQTRPRRPSELCRSPAWRPCDFHWTWPRALLEARKACFFPRSRAASLPRSVAPCLHARAWTREEALPRPWIVFSFSFKSRPFKMQRESILQWWMWDGNAASAHDSKCSESRSALGRRN